MEIIQNNDVLKDLFCGWMGGFAGIMASHPLDTIRIRLQLQKSYKMKYFGITDCALKIIKFEGFLGLFKGMTPIIISQVPVDALAFSGKEYWSKQLGRFTQYSESSKSLIAGFIGGAFSTIISCPAELLKIRSQSNSIGKTNYWKLTSKMVKSQGISSLYKGYLCTLIRDAPAYAVYFGIFEIGCNKLLNNSDSLGKVLLYQLLLGSVAGVASWVITYPFDIVKTVIQNSDRNMTMKKVFSDNYKRYGARFFVKGLGATCLWAIPTDAFWLMTYTQLHQRL